MAKRSDDPHPGCRERSPGVWEVRVQAPKHDDGRPRQISRTVRGTADDAALMHKRLTVEVADGKHDVAPTEGTVAQLVARYLETRRPIRGRRHSRTWQPATYATNKSMVDRLIVPALGAIPVRDLTALTIEATYRKWSAAGYGDATIARAHAVLRGALNYAARHELVDRNVALIAEAPTQPKRRRPLLDIGDVRRVIDLSITGAPRDPANNRPAVRPIPAMATLIRVASVIGARRSELAALRWCDIDLDRRLVRIAFALTVDDGRLVRKDTKTSDDTRNALALDQGTVDALRAWRVTSIETALKTGWRFGDYTPVWRTAGGPHPIRPDVITKAWRRLADRVGLEGVHFHDCRHAVATRLIADGFDPVTVADILGHSDRLGTTLNVYSHGIEANNRRAADHLGRLLDNAG